VRVMVALENRFLKTRSGNIYSTTVCDYNFWKRYLQVFDEVIVFARVAEIPETELDKPAANGPNVSFISLPTFIGPWQYLRHRHELKILAKKALPKADAYILRIPGIASSLLWHCLKKKGLPYGVEVVGHAWNALGKQTVKSLSRPFARYIFARNQKKQCQDAVAAAYVSEFYLQREYPPGCWSTHYSTLDLPDGAIIEDSKLEEKIISLKDVAERKRPLRICHAGTMEVAYKAQDILLEAVSISRSNGLNVELVLLGEGRRFNHYVEKSRQLGIEKYVRFLGMLPAGHAVREQLDLTDIFVLPSTTEGLPRIVIEAMARGLPCITTDVGGIPELLDAEDLVPPGDVKALAQKIESVFKSQARIEKMARRNLQRAQKYCKEELNCRRIEFYKKVAAASLVDKRTS